MQDRLYLVKFGDAAASGYPNSGVAVVVGERLFGGDSGFYYRGTFTRRGTSIAGAIEMSRHDPKWRSAFGDHESAYSLRITGHIQGQDIFGKLERLDTGLTLSIAFLWVTDLPKRPAAITQCQCASNAQLGALEVAGIAAIPFLPQS